MTARLLEWTRRTEQEDDLHLLIGQACGLLASVSFDLGNRDAATEQARSAWIYGRHIGHHGLCAWARGMQALVAYWSGRPLESLCQASCHRFSRRPADTTSGPISPSRLSGRSVPLHPAVACYWTAAPATAAGQPAAPGRPGRWRSAESTGPTGGPTGDQFHRRPFDRETQPASACPARRALQGRQSGEGSHRGGRGRRLGTCRGVTGD
jgi:hypothetical protein